MNANIADYMYLAFTFILLFLGILYASIKMRGGQGLILPLKRILYEVLKKEYSIDRWEKKFKKKYSLEWDEIPDNAKIMYLAENDISIVGLDKKFYDKKGNCKCYDCLSNESKDCYVNCQPATGFKYNLMPCKSCEFRSWCYTKYE